jgi:hypothetical protein
MGAECCMGRGVVECRNKRTSSRVFNRGVKKTCFRLVFVGIFRPESNRRLLHYHNFKLPLTND